MLKQKVTICPNCEKESYVENTICQVRFCKECNFFATFEIPIEEAVTDPLMVDNRNLTSVQAVML